MRNPITVVLMVFVMASCQTSTPTDLTGIRSVGIANGMGNKLTRNKVGTTIFNNDFESVENQSISPQVSQTAARNLKTRFSTVEVLVLQVPAAKQTFFANYRNIDDDAFRTASIHAGRIRGLDAVWVLYPRTYAPYGSRGAPLSGYEHRQENMLGFSNESGVCIALSELIDVRTGKVIAQPTTSFNLAPTLPISSRPLPTRKWQSHLAEYDAASRTDIIHAVTEAGKDRVVFLLNASKITTSSVR